MIVLAPAEVQIIRLMGVSPGVLLMRGETGKGADIREDCCFVMTRPDVARLSSTLPPASPTIRKRDNGGGFLSSHLLPAKEGDSGLPSPQPSHAQKELHC